MQEISKNILIEASQGSMKAFEEIYRAASGFVYSVSFRITNNQDDAEEIAQDVFLKVHKNLKSFQFKSSFKTWVYRITVNTAINAYNRRAKEEKRKGNYDVVVESTAAPDSTQETVQKRDSEVVIASLLKLLNPDQRACIVLREIQGLDYKEIAQVMGININTVRSRLKRARQALLAYGKKRGGHHEM